MARRKLLKPGVRKERSSKEFINIRGSISSPRCSDNHTPLRGEQQATIYDRRRCDENRKEVITYAKNEGQ